MGNLGPNEPVPLQSPLIYDPYRRREAWRSLSYMLIHAGFIHIGTNILVWCLVFAIWGLVFIVILVGVGVGTAVYYRYVANVETKVGYAAHFAGAIAGLLVSVNVLRNLQVETWENDAWWICFATYVALMAAAMAINFFWVDHFPPQRF